MPGVPVFQLDAAHHLFVQLARLAGGSRWLGLEQLHVACFTKSL
jgi:hypothetical protein